MTAVDVDFPAAIYDLRVPAIDGLKAKTIRVRFTGTVDLDRTDHEHMRLIEALRLGAPVRAVVVGGVAGKGFSHQGSDETVSYACTIRIDDVELGEPA